MLVLGVQLRKGISILVWNYEFPCINVRPNVNCQTIVVDIGEVKGFLFVTKINPYVVKFI